jgi:hypothetical protein
MNDASVIGLTKGRLQVAWPKCRVTGSKSTITSRHHVLDTGFG